MITDDGLYRLAIFLGSAAMLLIILYHFLEVNAVEESEKDSKPLKAASSQAEKSASSVR
jgi:oligosaccharyl transferase complex subunit OST4